MFHTECLDAQALQVSLQRLSKPAHWRRRRLGHCSVCLSYLPQAFREDSAGGGDAFLSSNDSFLLILARPPATEEQEAEDTSRIEALPVCLPDGQRLANLARFKKAEPMENYQEIPGI